MSTASKMQTSVGLHSECQQELEMIIHEGRHLQMLTQNACRPHKCRFVAPARISAAFSGDDN